MGKKHILAIGFKPGDVEISCGAVLAAHRSKGNAVTMIHLTNGDEYLFGSNRSNRYRQLKIEAEEAAGIVKANFILGNFMPHEITNTNDAQIFIANLIRKICPTSIITHNGNSTNSHFRAINALVTKAIFMCACSDVELNYPPYDGVKGLFFTEHFMNKAEFDPRIYVDTTQFMATWHDMIQCYEHLSTDTNFPYIEYYRALAKIRGIESYFDYACAFDVCPYWNMQFNDLLP